MVVAARAQPLQPPKGQAPPATVLPSGAVVLEGGAMTTELGPFEYADKIPLKGDFRRHGVRVVPGASARWG